MYTTEELQSPIGDVWKHAIHDENGMTVALVVVPDDAAEIVAAFNLVEEIVRSYPLIFDGVFTHKDAEEIVNIISRRLESNPLRGPSGFLERRQEAPEPVAKGRPVIHNPNCDGEHCLTVEGIVRVLPTGGDGNAILCRKCYEVEMAFRRDRNRELAPECQFLLPPWYTLKIYDPGAPS